MMTKKNCILLISGIALVGLVALPLVATAERGERRAQLKAACEPDVQRLCGGAEGKKEIFECLRDNRESLSPACAEGLEKARKHKKHRGARRDAIKQACEADAQNFCGGLEGRELIGCMKEHRDEVSAECREAVGKVRKGRRHHKRRAAFRDACGDDIKTHCGDIERGSGQLKACIQDSRSEFSPTCTEFLDRARERRDQGEPRD